MKVITIKKKDQSLKGRLALPSSKSISNRLLIIRAMAPSDFSIRNLSDSSDTVLLQKLLSEIRMNLGSKRQVILDTGNAGTVMRFLTAYLAFQPGLWILGGAERMKKRPISELVNALKSLGAEIDYLSAPGYPPLMIKGKIPTGNEVTIDPGISSQFISALLMTGTKIPGGLTLCMKGNGVSVPYIEMTIRIMDYFGVTVLTNYPLPWEESEKGCISQFTIPNAEYIPHDYTVESDWSAAAFWYEAAALSEEVDLTLEGLQPNSIQGDSMLVTIFRKFGVQTEFTGDGVHLTKLKPEINRFDFDFTDYPDIAPAVITTCAALGWKGRFDGLKSLKIKESDRVNVLRKHYTMLGIPLVPSSVNDPDPVIEFMPDARCQIPDARCQMPDNRCQVDSSGDHRIAMAFAPLALKLGSVQIEDPDVVSKSYPRFWEHMNTLGFEISHNVIND